jgi:hypothetical protein
LVAVRRFGRACTIGMSVSERSRVVEQGGDTRSGQSAPQAPRDLVLSYCPWGRVPGAADMTSIGPLFFWREIRSCGRLDLWIDLRARAVGRDLRLTPDCPAERLIHKLDTFTDGHRLAQSRVRDLIWKYYRALKAYRHRPNTGDPNGLVEAYLLMRSHAR